MVAPFPVFFGAGVVPGSIAFTTPGTYTFVVPNYNWINFDVKGGGGGGAFGNSNGVNGGDSSVTMPGKSIVAYGGGGAVADSYVQNCGGKGGCTNDPVPGYFGSNGGGSGPSGSAVYSGGGAGGGFYNSYSGGNGGRVTYVVSNPPAGAGPSPGVTITIVVGAGGSYGGGNGAVNINWS